MTQHRDQCGFTLTEIIIGLVIVGITLSLSYIYMSGYLPRQRLINQTQELQNLLLRARTFAQDRQKVYCLRITRSAPDPVKFEVLEDRESVNVSKPDFVCDNQGDTPVGDLTLQLDPDITIPDCSWDSIDAWYSTEGRALFFLGDGKIGFCNVTDCITDEIADEVTKATLEIILSSAKLPPARKAREIEIQAALGSISIIDVGKDGVGIHKMHLKKTRAATGPINYPPGSDPVINCE